MQVAYAPTATYARGGLFAAGGGLFAGGGGLFAGGPFAIGLIAGGPFASGLIAGGPFASGLNASGPFASGLIAGGPFASGLNAGGPFVSGLNAGGPFARGLNAGGPFASGLNAGGPFASGLNAAHRLGVPPIASKFPKNLPSALQHPLVIKSKINKELSLGRILGPFISPPPATNNYRVSPLGVVPKKVLGEFRMIHHLSYPAGLSVNDFIPTAASCVTYRIRPN